MDTTDSIFVHSPKTHYHSKISTSFMDPRQSSDSSPSKSDGAKSDMDGENLNSGTDYSGSMDSDVSDMIVENSSRFQKLNSNRRKSGESDYRPASESNNEDEDFSNNSKSGMESESEEDVSDNNTMARKTSNVSGDKRQVNVVSEDDSEESRSTSRSISNPAVSSDVLTTPPVRKSPLGALKKSPLGLTRNSPLGVSQQRSNPRSVAVMRGYRYAMHPSRTAATNISYKRYLAVDENDSDDSLKHLVRRRGRGKDSDSDFEVPGLVGSSEDEEESMDEESEEEYCPPKRKGGGGRRRKVSIYFCSLMCPIFPSCMNSGQYNGVTFGSSPAIVFCVYNVQAL